MKKFVLTITALIFSCLAVLTAQNFTQATIQRTSSLVITVYAKPGFSNVPSGTSLNILFSVSLPVDGPGSLTGASLVGASITAAATETIGGRKHYPFVIEGNSNVVLTQNADNPIATVTFPSSESGNLVQMNDLAGEGSSTNVFWYISYAGEDATNYDARFYGPNAFNGPDSYVEADLPLPVSLVSFKAEKFQERSSALSWSTASEFNTSHFTIQRSTDRKVWSNVGKVQAAGNSQMIKNYQYFDENVYNGRDSRLSVYYRLQMVDLDGQQKNSPIENVLFGTDANNANAFTVAVFPNPASEGVNVEWNAQDALQPTVIEMFDVSGKQVLRHIVAENSNREFINFGPSNIQSGLYLLRLMNGSEALGFEQIIVGQNR